MHVRRNLYDCTNASMSEVCLFCDLPLSEAVYIEHRSGISPIVHSLQPTAVVIPLEFPSAGAMAGICTNYLAVTTPYPRYTSSPATRLTHSTSNSGWLSWGQCPTSYS